MRRQRKPCPRRIREENLLNTLSKRARNLYARLKSGRFYKAYSKHTPKAMKELEDAGLVGISGRVNVIVACYVPRRGFKPFRIESWADMQ